MMEHMQDVAFFASVNHECCSLFILVTTDVLSFVHFTVRMLICKTADVFLFLEFRASGLCCYPLIKNLGLACMLFL